MRILLFLASNAAILVVISVVFQVFGLEGILQENGVDLNLQALLLMSAVIGFGGSFISLLAGGVLYDRLTPSGRIRGLGGLLAVGLASIVLIRFLPELGLSASAALGVAVSATFVFGLAISPAYYIPMSVFSIRFGRTRSGVLIGLIDAFGYGATMIFAPLAGALIRDQGWSALITMFVIVSVIAFALATAFLIAEHQASDPHR